MKHCGGFTLLELIIALVLTGVIALLVYGAAAVAVDTEERLREQDLTMRSESAWRALVVDALRNIRSAQDYQRPTFTVEPSERAQNGPSDRIWFITAGGTPPLTPDADWEVVLAPVAGRLVITATPIGVQAPSHEILGPRGITGVDAEALSGIGQQLWQQAWEFNYLPRAVALTFLGEDGPLALPLYLTLPSGASP